MNKPTTAPIRTLLARVKELDEKATSAPWEKIQGHLSHPEGYDVAGKDGVGVIQECCGYTGSIAEPADADLITEYRTLAPQLARALEAVLEAHKKVPVYEWCAFNLPSADECHLGDDEHIELANGDWAHVSVIEAWTCKECHHDTDDEIPDWPCPTVQAITEHLGGEK